MKKPPPNKRAGWALAAVLGAGLLIGGGMLAVRAILPAASRAVAIGGPFALQDGSGQTVTDASFRGKWMLVYFGYTHCPDVCPTTLSSIATAMTQLGPAARNFAPVFITVDPARDTARVMADYTAAFGPEFVGLSGSDAAIASAEKAYRVYAAKHPLEGGDYVMDHSSIIYVMDPQGHFVSVLSDQGAPGTMARKLLQLAGGPDAHENG
jgi:protein SCO1/2